MYQYACLYKQLSFLWLENTDVTNEDDDRAIQFASYAKAPSILPFQLPLVAIPFPPVSKYPYNLSLCYFTVSYS